MKTKIQVSFRIPKQAFHLLNIIKAQNSSLSFDLDTTARELVLFSDLLDFSEFSNDWGSLDAIENSLSEVE